VLAGAEKVCAGAIWASTSAGGMGGGINSVDDVIPDGIGGVAVGEEAATGFDAGATSSV
jgi:hypothetical protein